METEPTERASNSKREYFTSGLSGRGRSACSFAGPMCGIRAGHDTRLTVVGIDLVLIGGAYREMLGRVRVVSPDTDQLFGIDAGVICLVGVDRIAHLALVVDAREAQGAVVAESVGKTDECGERAEYRDDGNRLVQTHASSAKCVR